MQAPCSNYSTAVCGDCGSGGQHLTASAQPVHILTYAAQSQGERDPGGADYLRFSVVPLPGCLLCAVPPGQVTAPLRQTAQARCWACFDRLQMPGNHAMPIMDLMQLLGGHLRALDQSAANSLLIRPAVQVFVLSAGPQAHACLQPAGTCHADVPLWTAPGIQLYGCHRHASQQA